ncbi:hypothetical protein ACEPPN_000536 [Leptodophora sp. 'Broadleaf-Isolate-01']
MPPGDLQADKVEAFDRPPNCQLVELSFECFLQNINHVLFLFSEFELRRSFRPSEYMLGQNLATDMCLVLALGAKYSITQVNGTQNEWYTKARLRLLSEDLEDDMWMMRVLTMIYIFEIDDDINVSSRFLDAAVSIGLAIGFDTNETPLDTVDEADRCGFFFYLKLLPGYY